MLSRLKNKVFLTAVAGLLFQFVSKAYNVEYGEFQLWVDLISFLVIGSGIYSTFGEKK